GPEARRRASLAHAHDTAPLSTDARNPDSTGRYGCSGAPLPPDPCEPSTNDAAHRNPMPWLRFAGASQYRNVRRTHDECAPFQPPPRMTCLSPLAGPVGSTLSAFEYSS